MRWWNIQIQVIQPGSEFLHSLSWQCDSRPVTKLTSASAVPSVKWGQVHRTVAGPSLRSLPWLPDCTLHVSPAPGNFWPLLLFSTCPLLCGSYYLLTNYMTDCLSMFIFSLLLFSKNINSMRAGIFTSFVHWCIPKLLDTHAPFKLGEL